MPDISKILDALTAPPDPAAAVVTVSSSLAERIAEKLAKFDPYSSEVSELQALLAEPNPQLWAIHSVGPGDVYPCLNKEDAERQAQELRDLGHKMKAERIARGESVEMWRDWVANVIPSPWEPAEHFEIMAEEWLDSHRDLVEQAKATQAENEALKAELATLKNPT